MDKLKSKKYIGIFIIATIIFLFVFASEKMFFVLSIFKPIMAGIAIAYILDGMVRFLNRRLKIKRGIAIVIVLVSVLALVTVCGYFAVPFLVSTIKTLIANISSALMGHNSGINELVEYIRVDKKAKGSKIAIVYVNEIGSFEIKEIDISDIYNYINEVFNI